MDTAWDVIGVGTASVDDLLTVETYPPADDKARVLESRRKHGGLVATALVAATRLGARCAYRGVLTDDALGQSVREALRREKVDVDGAPGRPDGCTIHSVIVVERARSTRTIFFSAPRDYPAGVLDGNGIARSCRVLMVDQLGLAPALAARKAGVPVVADLEWPEHPECPRFLATVDHLILSRAAAQTLTGKTDPTEMVRALHTPHPRSCTAVSLGEEGIRYTTGSGSEIRTVPALKVDVVETNGCGDVLHGAYAAALARGRTVADALAEATRAAGVFAGRPGGWEHIPTHAELSGYTS